MSGIKGVSPGIVTNVSAPDCLAHFSPARSPLRGPVSVVSSRSKGNFHAAYSEAGLLVLSAMELAGKEHCNALRMTESTGVPCRDSRGFSHPPMRVPWPPARITAATEEEEGMG